ncbi:MAG TPA: carboxypeptidase-like regulatory domain-containing protein [Polyangiaceae bacterium]|nr:carboxypeptidase-like regulatory domain-containing protein [Polyangiaceae bacterium]
MGLGFGGCGAGGNTNEGSGAGGNGGDGGSPSVVMPEGTSLFLEVKTPSGDPVPGALILIVNETSVLTETTSDELGQALLEGLAPGRIVAQVHAPGHSSAAAVARLDEGQHGGAVVILHPLGAPIKFDASADAVVAGPSGVTVEIPGGSLVTQTGEPVEGTAEVTFVPLDPTTDQIQLMPGPLEGIYSFGDTPVNLESVYMAEISVWQAGNPLKLAPEAKATIRLPVPEALSGRYAEGNQVEGWWFDVNTGTWIQEGFGTIVASPKDPTRLEWSMEVSHFTWWNCDEPWTDKYCYNVKVLDQNNNPAPNVPITGLGVTYPGQGGPEYTNAAGQACIDVKKGETSRIYLGELYYSDPANLPPGTYKEVISPNTAIDCWGESGKTCEALELKINTLCVPGSYQTCYSGNKALINKGICQAGYQYCNANGSAWNSCLGEVLPQAESCANTIDDDCDGAVNKNCPVICQLGTTKPCYTGPAGTQNVGSCKGGTQTCDANGTAWSSGCSGEVTPEWFEWCYDNVDNNCNGTQAECSCAVETMQPCYTGPAGTQQNPPCKAGTQYCNQFYWNGGGSTWTNCMGEMTPAPSEVCATVATDDNCNGVVNEGPMCCTTNQSCGMNTECKTYLCDNGLCKSNNAPAGTPLSMQNQTPGDCKLSECNGSGGITNKPDDSDTPNDGKECTKDTCSIGVPQYVNKLPHTPCNNNQDVCNASGACVDCFDGTDCPSQVCAQNICQMTTCIDNVKNGSETDVDCGGPCGACLAGKACASPSDCLSQVCVNKICQAPKCSDAVKNGTETDIDCGGMSCPKCANTKACVSNTDCSSNLCLNNKCTPTSCVDGVKNGQESDLDCGGSSCPPCLPGKNCTQPGDCTSNNCSLNKCSSTCPDAVKNGTETDVDCGGDTCLTKCGSGKSCSKASDCQSNVCSLNKCN